MDTQDRNVVVRDFEGNTISEFWQYDLIDWELFYNCLHTVIDCPHDWAVFDYDENVPTLRGAPHPPGPGLVRPGIYIILSPAGDPITIDLTRASSRPRHPSVSNTVSGSDHYRQRVRERDPCCLISHLPVARNDYSRFKAAHIFPRSHDTEWNKKGFPSLITDTAPLNQIGGASKIDSVQNILLLRSDLHDAWDNYKFAVNPDGGYVVVPFSEGYDDIAGKILKLDHITDPTLRPIDEFFRDHFLQGVLKNMKGAGEPNWDYEDALGDGRMDLSRLDVWGNDTGKAHLEFEMAHRLHGSKVKG